ncbi:MAG: class I SAM-dependent methyltransferase [Nanoarchaeota archaeon]|nr:class I SAM-dependent methyltransferase [Nanoarchaeota archaeon]
MSNRKAYEAKNVVKEYSAQKHLQKAEETILKRFKERFKKMKMLDIGVGGGRTTYHFANLVKEYVGIDYSKNMVKECIKKFPNYSNKTSFKVCDARSMRIFNNDYFDFILFSFNGIDYMSHQDRLKTLEEIKRLCKKNGFFCFSTHNLQSIGKVFSIQISYNPIKMIWRFFCYLRIIFSNKNIKKIKDKNYAIINDGAHRFKLRTFYIKPKEQIKQLNHLGFKNIQIYSSLTGEEIKNKKKLNWIKDSWLYFHCQV